MYVKKLGKRIRNFFIGLKFVPTVMYKFLTSWRSVNSITKAAAEAFRNQLSEMNLPDKTAERLTKKYASIKDEVFNEVLTNKSKKQDSSVKRRKESRKFSSILFKTLPGSQVYLESKNGNGDGLKGAVALDATKTAILAVGLSRTFEMDIYWIAVCIASYLLYSSCFAFTSGFIQTNRVSTNGFTKSILNTLGELSSDTSLMAVVGLTLSLHVVLGAPYIPLYHQIQGLDFVEHYLSGFGIGLAATKAYEIFVSHVSYTNALAFLGLDKFNGAVANFEANAVVPFVLYSSVLNGLVWEMLEEVFENFTPRIVNIFFWNGIMDVIMDVFGALTAYFLLSVFRRQKRFR
ncbi:MAG: hypothetical protein U9O89_01815 [Thermoproteota archaeon]|nr:hypothetical protein [Thermoproteota archaeon]